MKPLALHRRLAALALAAGLLAIFAASAAAKPVGLVREIPVGGHIVDIAAGPEGNLWFTQNHPNGPGEHARITVSRITPRAKPSRFTAGLSHRAEPSMIVAGADRNLWFTWEPRGAGGGGVGRVTPGGRITLFPEPAGQHGSPFEIAATPDGSIWFTHAAFFAPTGQAIGRASPLGEITEYSAGLTPSSNITHPTAGPDGNLWFGDESNDPAVGRLNPGSGEISLFGGLPPHEFTIFEGPTPGTEGNLWFSANEPTPLVERVTPAGVVERFGTGLDSRTANVGPFAVSADGSAWFRIWKDAPPGRRDDERDLTAVGRIDPSGRITEFSDCLRPMQGYEGPNNLIRGPEGNIWFTTWSSGDPAVSSPSSTPSIGRITADGKITEFRLGLDRESSLDKLVFASGKLWSFDRSTESIVMLTPTSAPANTFLFYSPPKHGNGVRVYVPGPGRLKVSGAGLRTTTTPARDCGQATVRVAPGGELGRRLDRRGSVRVRARVTFTPRGGSAFSRVAPVTLRRSR